jgi:hypothetical protein
LATDTTWATESTGTSAVIGMAGSARSNGYCSAVCTFLAFTAAAVTDSMQATAIKITAIFFSPQKTSVELMTYVFSLAKDHIFDKGNRIRHLIT